MKLKIILVLLIISNTAVSQAKLDTSVTIGLSKPLFKKILNKQFTNLITGQSRTSIGTYASLDTKQSEASFSGTAIFKKGSTLTIKGSGAVSDGLYSIFTNSKLNTQVSLDFQYSFLALGKRKLIYDRDTFRAYIAKVDQLENEFELKQLEINSDKDRLSVISKRNELFSQINKIDSLIDCLNLPANLVDSFYYEKAKVQIMADGLDTTLAKYPFQLTRVRVARNLKSSKKESSMMETVEGFAFGWFSIGYKVNNNSFKIFDPTAAFTKQIVDTDFVSHEVRLQYSRYHWSRIASRTYYWNIGCSFNYTDNFDKLKKKEINEIVNYGPNPNDRTTTKKYNAYQGSYLKDLKRVRIYGDIYYFMFEKNFAAIHLYPEWKMEKSQKPVGNIGTGFLISFKDTKAENAILNAEIFYDFLDVFNTNESEYKLLERNNIGLRFAFPMKFKN